jgi:arsenate reductase
MSLLMDTLPHSFGMRVALQGVYEAIHQRKPTFESETYEMADMNERMRILFLCTGNSCRSQMAEGWARHLRDDGIEPYSAGVRATQLDPRAVLIMAEAGIDIAGYRAKEVSELMHIEFDYVITLCGHAHETCPVFPGTARIVHRGFDDPPVLAAGAESDEEALSHYRRVRDEIREFVERLPEAL